MKPCFYSKKIGTFVLLMVVLLLLQGCSEDVASRDIEKNSAKLVFEDAADKPPTTKTLFILADILATQGKDQQAELVLRKIIAEEPQFSPAWNSLAELQMRQRHIDEAIKTISGALKLNSNDPVLINNLGMCWMVRHDYKKALEMFTTASGMHPENARYRANMAVTLALMGRDSEALSLFRQTLPESQAQHNLKTIRDALNKGIENNNTSEEETAIIEEYIDIDL